MTTTSYAGKDDNNVVHFSTVINNVFKSRKVICTNHKQHKNISVQGKWKKKRLLRLMLMLMLKMYASQTNHKSQKRLLRLMFMLKMYASQTNQFSIGLQNSREF